MDLSTCIKIGSRHVFDTKNGIIYEVIRKGEEVVGFKKAYTVTIDGKDKSSVLAIGSPDKIPAGVVKKAIKLLEEKQS